MITAIDPSQPREFTLESDKDNPTIWKLRNPSPKLEQYTNDLVLKSAKSKNRLEKTIELTNIIINLYLLGADNFQGKNGYNAIWERDESAKEIYDGIKPWSDKTLMQIEQPHRGEIASYVMAGFQRIPDNKKKNILSEDKKETESAEDKKAKNS